MTMDTIPIDSLAVITPEELASPMMSGVDPMAYETSWWTWCTEFYAQWPIASLLLLCVAVYVILYVVKKVAIALV